MAISEIMEFLGFERAVSKSEIAETSEERAMVLEQLKDINIDKVYFCDDNVRSYPAVFIKEVKTFDQETLREIAQIHNQAWNYKKVLFLYVYNETEVRIYNCAEKPFAFTKETKFEKELNKLELERATIGDKKRLNKIHRVFSAVAIDTGIIWTIEEAYHYRKQINHKRKVDKYLVESLSRLALELQEKEGLNKDIIHKVVLRSLFLLFLEDRAATDQKFYNTIKPGAKTYFDFLDDKNATYDLFQVLQDRFNGNVFTIDSGEIHSIENSHLDKIRKCLTFGFENTGQKKLFENWRLFNFKIIAVELLSEIYENFLADLDSNAKRNTGTFFTPASLVELILNEKLPVKKKFDNYKIKVLDPACGSGIFLVECFKRVVKRYENKHKIKKLTDFDKLKELLLNNIYGIEIDRLSLNVAAFSLYLALLDNLEPKSLWRNKKLPLLIHDPDDESIKEQGQNLFRRDAIGETKDIEALGFDLVVGNPPFGTKNLLPSIKQYSEEQAFAKENALPFLHKSIKFARNGEVALLFNTKVLTNTGVQYQNFRRWLFNNCYVEKIYNFSILRRAPKDFGGQLFSGASVPVSIVMFQKEYPENASDRIIYYAPKTFVKSNVLEGIVIDKSDVKYLPREECKKPDTKIWKVAMWGGTEDINFISILIKKYPTLKCFFKKNKILYGVGLELSSPRDKKNDLIPKLPLHTPKTIKKYFTEFNLSNKITGNEFRRLGNIDAYFAPHILLNEGVKVLKENKKPNIIAAFLDYDCAFTKGIVGVYSTKKDVKILKLINIYLNSRFIRYYALITTSSWGIERDVIKHKELFQAPFILSLVDQGKIDLLLNYFNQIQDKRKELIKNENLSVEKKINALIERNLSDRQKIILEDFDLRIDLFHKKEKSKAFLPINSNEDYATILSCDLNDFLDGQNLFVNPIVFPTDRSSPLAMVKLSFDDTKKGIIYSKEHVFKELNQIDKKLWEKKSTNIYFRKHLNYYDGDDIYIIRPNQKRFWTNTAAMEDATELILEILTEK